VTLMTWLPVVSTSLLGNKYSVISNLLPYCYCTQYIYLPYKEILRYLLVVIR